MICELCGTFLRVGDWPFCSGNPANHQPPMEYHPFKAYWEEHLSEKPVYIESTGQRNRLMHEAHATERPKGQGMPGCWL